MYGQSLIKFCIQYKYEKWMEHKKWFTNWSDLQSANIYNVRKIEFIKGF